VNTILIVAGSAGTVIALGACLRWSVRPMVIAFRLGAETGRRAGARDRRTLEATRDAVVADLLTRNGELARELKAARQQ
jgi:hypothetical protein